VSTEAGQLHYYGRFRRSALSPLLRRINTYLMRWARRKYKDLRAHKRVKAWWDRLIATNPTGFTHWEWMRSF
jgi:RNA-directed DNA polymerase